jgi:hypothetical protein
MAMNWSANLPAAMSRHGLHRRLLVGRGLADHRTRLGIDADLEGPRARLELAGQQLVEDGADVVTGVELDHEVVLQIGPGAGLRGAGAHDDDVALLVGQLHHGLVGAAEVRVHRPHTLRVQVVEGLRGRGHVVEATRADVGPLEARVDGVQAQLEGLEGLLLEVEVVVADEGGLRLARGLHEEPVA